MKENITEQRIPLIIKDDFDLEFIGPEIVSYFQQNNRLLETFLVTSGPMTLTTSTMIEIIRRRSCSRRGVSCSLG